MQLCFIDEAGDLGALRDPPAPNDQPVLAIAGLFVDAGRLASLTHDYLDLKHRFFPNLHYPSIRRLDRILPEMKGAEIRRHATRGNARQRAHAIGFLDHIMGLLGRHEIRLVARISIKARGRPFRSTAVYTSSIQALCTYFEHFLTQRNSGGLCIADSRSKSKNLRVSHSIFTQKFSADTGVFEPRDIFLDFIETRTGDGGADLGPWLAQLFEGHLRTFSFDAGMRAALLDACRFDWTNAASEHTVGVEVRATWRDSLKTRQAGPRCAGVGPRRQASVGLVRSERMHVRFVAFPVPETRNLTNRTCIRPWPRRVCG